MIPLSKTLHPDDYLSLLPQLEAVEAVFTRAQPQHEARKWEYALTLAAIEQWMAAVSRLSCPPVADVGGHGSPFWYLLEGSIVIDPKEHDRMDLATYVQARYRTFPIVTCLSVIEHVPDLDQFLYHLSCLTAPGGLLVITTDIWDREGPDQSHFHWMRERIFTPREIYDTLQYPYSVRLILEKLGFSLFGGLDPTYHGDQLYGSYSFGSLVMRKRP